MLKKNLLNLLEEKNISLSELARQTKVPKSNLSAWLKGRSPNLEQLDRVAQFFNLSIESLAFGRKKNDGGPLLMYRTEIDNGRYEIIVRKIPEDNS